MKHPGKPKQIVSKKDVALFLAFYFISSVVYYTASWISWGGFKPGHPSYFTFEEFSASGGAQFLISLLITVPIWYLNFVVMRKLKLRTRFLSHIIFLPVYVLVCYFGMVWVTEIFHWAMYWGGYKFIWTVYILVLFYFVQFGFIHAYVYFKSFKKEEKEKTILRETTLKSEITALKAQLNPHFLHNLFNSINATIPPENEHTRELIIQLSDLFRYQNYASQNEFVTIKEEIDFIESYLQLMQIRLKERLQFNFNVSEDVYNSTIAPMLLQPLIENAINHGIATKITPSTLSVTVEKRNENIYFCIEDTGIGIADKKALFTKGLGLSNTKLRLEKIYNSELIIDDVAPSGTKISFII